MALLLLILPGAIVARIAQLTWPITLAIAPALTYGVVALAIIPFGALGIPWNAWTALASLAVVAVAAAVLAVIFARYRDAEGESRAAGRGPALTVAAGVMLGVVLIGFAAVRGIPHWQSIPSTWDAVWHANTVRFILDTGQASSTHMGELRNVETHALLYYPSAFHALAAVFCQLTGAAPTTGYTLSSLAAAVWLFPASAAVLTWRLLRTHTSEWRTAAAAAAAAALSASFTAVPYVEFDTAAMPNLAAYGIAAPTFVLITSTLRHRDRIPVAVLALTGVFSVHITGGVVVVLFLAAWWLLEALWRPVRGRPTDLATLAAVVVPTALILLPQFISVRAQEDIIAGHSYLTYLSKKRGLFDAVFQHSRHLNDFPVQYALFGLTGVGAVILLVKKIWWPLAVWLLLVVVNVDAGTPLGGPVGALAGAFGEFFYKDPRRLAAATTLLLTPMAGVALLAIALLSVATARKIHRAAGDRAGVVRHHGGADGGDQRGRRVALLSPAPIPLRRQVRLGDRQRKRPGRHGVSGDAARGAADADRQWQHRRHRVDVRGGWAAPAVDPLRLSLSAGAGLLPVHLLGVRRRRGHRSTCPGRRPGTQHSLRAAQRAHRAWVRHPGRAKVARQIEVVGEDLRQRWSRDLRMARKRTRDGIRQALTSL